MLIKIQPLLAHNWKMISSQGVVSSEIIYNFFSLSSNSSNFQPPHVMTIFLMNGLIWQPFKCVPLTSQPSPYWKFKKWPILNIGGNFWWNPGGGQGFHQCRFKSNHVFSDDLKMISPLGVGNLQFFGRGIEFGLTRQDCSTSLFKIDKNL